MEHSGRRAGAAWKEVGGLTARLQATLADELQAIRALLSETQWVRLPAAIRTPTRQFVPTRQLGRSAAAAPPAPPSP
jgi:hypothetical protein